MANRLTDKLVATILYYYLCILNHPENIFPSTCKWPEDKAVQKYFFATRTSKCIPVSGYFQGNQD